MGRGPVAILEVRGVLIVLERSRFRWIDLRLHPFNGAYKTADLRGDGE